VTASGSPPATTETRSGRQRVVVVLVFAAALAVFAARYLPSLPRADGHVGYDFAYFLPQLLDGAYWISLNGPFAVPWFTPSFCGGIPVFANAQNTFYSVPQAMFLVFDPLTVLRATFLAFGAVGFWGAYAVSRGVFGVTRSAATLAAVVFLFSDFFVARFLIGHLTFHVFPLVPWIAYFALRPLPAARTRRSRAYLADSLFVGLLIAYAVHAGAAIILPPLLLSLVAVELMRDLRGPAESLPVGRLVCGSTIALLISTAKISAVLAYAGHFPRDLYPIPGLGSIVGTLGTVLSSLFLSDGFAASRPFITNDPFRLGPHEFFYGVSIVPGLLIAAAAAIGLRGLRTPVTGTPGWNGILVVFALVAVLAVPLAFNFHHPEWHAILKRIPFVRSNTTLLRWILAYILPVTVATALAFDVVARRLSLLSPPVLAIGLGLAVVAQRVLQPVPDISLRGNSYDLTMIAAAWGRFADDATVPPVTSIRSDPLGPSDRRNLNANEVFVTGASQMGCYESMFGFRLENFPVGDLAPGPIARDARGNFNLKNPACYVFPEENGCAPGDHFRADQGTAVDRFAARRPFPFSRPLYQSVANWVSLGTTVSVGFAFLTLAATAFRRRRSRYSDADRL
jgi:hypothetical protein